jgi:hypothetical protein
MRTDILMLTGSSRASEVAKEKGSMADIHLPQVVVVGEYREHFSTLGKLWATGSDHRWSVLSSLTRQVAENVTRRQPQTCALSHDF